MKLYEETKVVDKINLDKLFEIFDDGTTKPRGSPKRATMIVIRSDQFKLDDKKNLIMNV